MGYIYACCVNVVLIHRQGCVEVACQKPVGLMYMTISTGGVDANKVTFIVLVHVQVSTGSLLGFGTKRMFM